MCCWHGARGLGASCFKLRFFGVRNASHDLFDVVGASFMNQINSDEHLPPKKSTGLLHGACS